MKLKSYNRFGDDLQYTDITFIADNGNDITIGIHDKNITIECCDVSIEDVEEAIKLYRGGILNENIPL